MTEAIATPLTDAAAKRGSDLGAANEMMSGIWQLARSLERDRAKLAFALQLAEQWIVEARNQGCTLKSEATLREVRQVLASLEPKEGEPS